MFNTNNTSNNSTNSSRGFEYCSFDDGYDTFAVDSCKYSKEDAIEIAKKEKFGEHCKGRGYLAVGKAFVRHRAGVNEDSEPLKGWWLEYTCYPRSRSCWVFHFAKTKDEKFSNDYEYVELL